MAPDPFTLSRVMIVGGPGAGKSTFARRLGAITGLPVRHMDLIHWRPGWVERPRPEKIALARAVMAEERWIFEGGLSETYPERAARADLVVFLDLPVTVRLWRAMVRRRVQEALGASRPDVPENCPERFDPDFIRWIVTTARRHRERHLALVAAQPAGKGLHLWGRRAAERWLIGAAASRDGQGGTAPGWGRRIGRSNR